MNYSTLILTGYFDENSRENLQDYFYQKFKKAEKKNFSPELFFGGCLKVVKDYENEVKRLYYNRQKELNEYLAQSDNSDAVTFFKTELENIEFNDFPIPLNPYTSGRYNGHLFYSEIQHIKKSITESKIRVKLESEKKKLKKISKSLNSIIENEKKNQTLGFTCNLHPETVEEIYIFMADKNYLSGELNDFQVIFSKVSIPFENPVKWLIKRGEKPNKLALWTFLNLMTGINDFTTKENKKKIENFFIDFRGNPISLNKPDTRQNSQYINDFETLIKEAKGKTRPA